jgi:hypothetical protein
MGGSSGRRSSTGWMGGGSSITFELRGPSFGETQPEIIGKDTPMKINRIRKKLMKKLVI